MMERALYGDERDLLNHLRWIEGHVRGLQQLVNGCAPCCRTIIQAGSGLRGGGIGVGRAPFGVLLFCTGTRFSACTYDRRIRTLSPPHSEMG